MSSAGKDVSRFHAKGKRKQRQESAHVVAHGENSEFSVKLEEKGRGKDVADQDAVYLHFQ